MRINYKCTFNFISLISIPIWYDKKDVEMWKCGNVEMIGLTLTLLGF